MKVYLSGTDAVNDLHESGFINDFEMIGNDLFWVQEKIIIKAGEFTIFEYHKIADPKTDMGELIVFGIIALYHNTKGILINHYNRTTVATMPAIANPYLQIEQFGGRS